MHHDEVSTPLSSLIVFIADNKFFLGRRYAEWCTSAPALESAVAAAAMAQDEIGHARSLYPLLAELTGSSEQSDPGGRTTFHNASCLDDPFADWMDFVAANVAFDTALSVLLEAARDSSHLPIQQRARRMLEEFISAFEAYDIDALTDLIREDARQSMPPYDLWLEGRDDIFTWFLGPGIGCKGSRLVPVDAANGAPAFGQYKPNESGDGYVPWAICVVQPGEGGIKELTFFLDTERLFPLFGLPLRIEA